MLWHPLAEAEYVVLCMIRHDSRGEIAVYDPDRRYFRRG
jgi:hypothetical protein